MGRKTAWIWLVLGAVLSITAGVFTYKTVSVAQSMSVAKPNVSTVPVLVLSHDVPARAVVKEKDVEVKEMPSDLVPKDAVKSKDEAVGKIARVPLLAGEVLVSDRLVSPTATGKDVAFIMPEDYVVVAIPASDLISRSDILEPGDKVDIMVSLDTGDGASNANIVTLDALQNVVIQGVLVGKISDIGNSTSAQGEGNGDRAKVLPPEGLLIAVSPQDALVIKFFKDSGGMFDLALRAPTNGKASETEPVDLKYLMDRYQVELPQPSITISGVTSMNGGVPLLNSNNGGK
jgi:pilus assembly protein CpaB